jgi:outer membrane protein assembly factor BamA
MESNTIWSLRLSGTSAEWSRYFGLGNNTSLDIGGVPHSINFFQVRENRFTIFPSVTVPLAQGLTLQVGPQLRYWDTGHTFGTLFAEAHPYGAGPFGTIGGRTDLRYDTRDALGLPTKGVFIDVAGRAVPAVWDAQSAYGSVRAQASTYLTPAGVPLQPTLALRVGGMKVWGTAPYQDLAHIGATQDADDPYTVRGFYPDRFTGDASAWGNAQLSFIIAHPKILVPTDLGLVALNDVGRVFQPGEHSSDWHDGYGGGFFVGLFRRSITVTAIAVHSSERTFYFIGAGTGL